MPDEHQCEQFRFDSIHPQETRGQDHSRPVRADLHVGPGSDDSHLGAADRDEFRRGADTAEGPAQIPDWIRAADADAERVDPEGELTFKFS